MVKAKISKEQKAWRKYVKSGKRAKDKSRPMKYDEKTGRYKPKKRKLLG